MYYLRTRPAVNAIQFTVDAAVIKGESGLVGSREANDH